MSQLAGSFLLAVGGACGVALGLGRAVDKLNVPASRKLILSRLVPFAAVCTAGIVNVSLMRGGEIVSGIDVFKRNKDGTQESVGKSRVAAAIAVAETAASRVMNATPIMVIPPLVLVALQKRGLGGRWVLPTNIGLIFTTSIVALPFALGVFPQRQKIEGKSLEERFKGYGELEFNRGI